MSNTTNLQVTYRNVADIASAMQKFQEKAMPSIGEYQKILTNIKKSKLDGQTNINIRNYFADVHYLINDTILTTFDAITSIITLYAYDLEKYDGSQDFIVIQSELEKKYPKYQHISDTFSSNHDIIKSAYDSISEYIDEGLLDVSNITSRLEEMHVFFETMYQQICDEGSSYGDKLIEINELLTNLQKVIDKAMEIKITEYDFSQLSNIEGINELNDSLFNIQSFFSNEEMMEKLDEAAYSLEAYKRLKDAEAKRKSLIIDIAIAAAIAVGSVAVVAATGGLAAGIIATGLAVTSAVDVGFKVSEVVENESVIHKSRENDMSPGFNPIRDKLFNENQEAYDKIKSLNSTALGFFQFATIFVGGVGLIDGWKSASTVAQKGLAVLKAGGRAGLKIGREYAENYVEDKVAGFLSSISSYVLMQQGYSSEAAQHIGDKRSNVLMSLYDLGGSVKGAVGGVEQYKQAKRDRAVIGDKEIIGKANSIRRNDDIEITPRKKYDTSNCEDLRNRLANTKNDSNPKNKVNKPKTDVDGETKKNVGKDKSDRHNVKKHEKDLDPQYTDKVKNIPPEEKIPYDEKYINGDGYIEIDDSFYNRPIRGKELDLVNSMNSTKTKVDKINMPANIHDFPLEAIVHLDNEGLRKFEKAYTYDEIKAYVDNMPDLQPGSKYVAKQDGSNYKQGEVRRFTHSKQQMDVMMEKIYNRDNVDGKLSEPYSDREIHWKPGDERYNVVDLGHDAGHEFKKTSLLYKKGLISDKQFKSFENDLSHFHIENSSANRSRVHEE